MGEKGSRKNKFRVWLFNKRRMKREKQELEEEKKKKTVAFQKESRIKMILASFLGMFTFLLGAVLPSKKEKTVALKTTLDSKMKPKLEEIEKTLSQIKSKTETVTEVTLLEPVKEELKTTKDKFSKMKKEISEHPEEENFIQKDVKKLENEMEDVTRQVEKKEVELKEKETSEKQITDSKKIPIVKKNQFEEQKQEMRKQLLEQQKTLLVLEQEVARSEKGTGKKKKKDSYLKRLCKSTLFVNLGIASVITTAGSMLGVLTGLIFTNHGIRTMRNFNKKENNRIPHYDVDQILSTIKKESDALAISIVFCADSLKQLQSLKQEIATTYKGYDQAEIEHFNLQIEALEQELLKEQEALNKKKEMLEHEYEHGKIKLKKKEERR